MALFDRSARTFLAAIKNRKPLGLPTHTVANAPSATLWEGCQIYVTNGAAGAKCVAFSDGTNWKRVDTLATISAT